MHPYLPPELIEAIIEQVEDEKTVAAFSLTCRAWAPIAQSKYFRNLRFGPFPNDTSRFLELIRESPHIALLPRSIRSNQWDVRDEEDGIYLAQIAPLLPNVSDLSLEAMRLASCTSRKIVDGFPALQKLQIYACNVELHFLSLFFQSHPTLRTLSFHLGKVVQVNTYQELLPLRRLQHLRAIRLENISLLAPLLIHHGAPLAPIERLGLDLNDDAGSCALIFGLRHTLHVLEIGASYFEDNPDTCDGPCISINSLLN